MSKLEELKKLRKQLDIEIIGKDNFPKDAPSIIVSNHNRLMDIFYLPLAFDQDIISLVSARLVYKQDKERLSYINKYLNAFPIEAHGGKVYSEMCLRNSSEFIKNNLSLSIWPEGAYIDDTEHVYKGRTGGARILFNALDNLCYAYFLPVSIDIKTDNDLDSYVPDIHDKVKITINEPILPDEYFYRYKSSETDKDKNIVLHDITDTGMKIIADSLNREYVDDYIELYPKGNVIFSDGTTINTELAQTRDFLDKYDKELKSVSRKLIYSIQK